ncbi:MAG: 23S rRNA (adenine(1618)-N(6))-methyltransferase [Bacteroidetes bacterium GWF2_40_14]|nr:MAG: 23S rRNA (adenine(1618)-N(6))-methyltransferase [Bacteroidetes bacterium GWF2_40_14]
MLHPKNRHQGRYDLKELIKSTPELEKYVIINSYNDQTVDFFDPAAVRMLNKAILKLYYDVNFWEIPAGYLCPPIPGRADYIHHIADLLADFNNGVVPEGSGIKCLDIGVGSSCIYPIIGTHEYLWSFTGSESDERAMESAREIVKNNPSLEGKIKLRFQTNSRLFFTGVIRKGDMFDICICNPPFHASAEEARESTMKKLKNLRMTSKSKPTRELEGVLNFGGQNSELWCKGGEVQFVRDLVLQSKEFASQCRIFSSLVSKKESLGGVYAALRDVNASMIKTIQMEHGNKISRIVAWSFTEKQDTTQE